MKYILTLFLVVVFYSGNLFAQVAILVDAGADVTICIGSSAVIGGNPSVSVGFKPYTYSWSPAAGLSNATVANPTATPLTTTKYYLTGTDILNHVATDSVIVNVDSLSSTANCYPLTFYNTFTPNKDKINDTWQIINGDKYLKNTLEVYNRYGKLVYSASPYDNKWDGTIDGDDLPASTYFYVFSTSEGGTVYKGSVTIIR